ncbi:unnamed protein product [Brachionus calyciflorus]|uniref:RBBP5 n=1 Tax=Brachionus calyciflorus TaxID=104777 RepID=A0A813MAF8_9BILA|nr:unnamed protein product [Brachionus calyciflorus]
MNIELLESFGQNFPEDFDGTLDCMSVAITCQFNKRGTLLAVGCNDGRIFIWDFLTRGIAKIITAHVHPVCSLSWNRTGYYLLSASSDNTVCIFNVVTGDCVMKYRFPSPFIKVQFHPRDNSVFLVTLLKYPSLLVKTDGSYNELPLDDPNEPNVVSSFDRRGDHIFCGNGKGKITVFKTSTREIITTFKVTNGSASSSAIRQIEFARRGTSFLVSTADRIIRVYDTNDVLPTNGQQKLGDPEPLQKLQDLVNRTLWKKCCFSGDGEYICAGSSRQHSLYIWEKSVGNLVKILHGTKGEMLLDVVWHPVRPLIASVSSGVVSIWSQTQVENWSAFAPDFKELDENVEYEERESEYDLEDEDKSIDKSKDFEDEEIDVDVQTIQPIQAFLSSDEEDEKDQLLFLTITPEFDEVEEQAEISKDDKNLMDSKNDKKIQGTVYDINLPNAPVNEIHPLNTGLKRQASSNAALSTTSSKSNSASKR